MHPNQQLIQTLYDRLNAHDADGIASCYDEHATFEDIAFTLSNRKQIYAMWHMICSKDVEGNGSDIRANLKNASADDSSGYSEVEENYFYGKGAQRRPVQNHIFSRYEFRNGLIICQKDDCDPVSWANQAIGGAAGFLAGRVKPLRQFMAMRKVRHHLPAAFDRE